MVKKSLQSWYNSGDISSSQKEIIKKFGVGDYYPERERRDFKKVWYWNEILDRNKSKIDISGQIEKMIFFSADWNNNLLIVVNENNDVNLVVYEMPMQTGNPAGGDLKKFLTGSYNSSYSALNEARELENKLKYNDNPILACNYGLVNVYFYKDYDSSFFPMDFGKDDMVKRVELPSDARYNPDKYIKPLDVALAVDSDMVHSCIYLGDKKVCHVITVNRKGVVRIDSWSYFLNNVLSSTDKIIRYHPVIAFKKPDTIIRHVAKSIEGTSNYFVPGMKNRSGRFNIVTNSRGESNNCENFTNACVFGLNFSELDKREGENKATAILFNAESGMSETTRKLDGLASYPSSKISDIKGYIRQGNNNRIDSCVDREGIEMDERIEVQPHNLYRLNNRLEFIDILTLGLGRLFL